MQTEKNWLTKIRHQNIISLIGYCIHGEIRFLVYEMMQNGSLESQLHGIILPPFPSFKSINEEETALEDTNLYIQ